MLASGCRALSILAAFVAGCFADAGPDGESPCEPGQQISCDCLKGDGVQVCRVSGAGFDPCQCGDESTGDTAATDGATATSSTPTTTGQVSIGDSTSPDGGSVDEAGSTSTSTASSASGSGSTTMVDPDTTTGSDTTDVVINEVVHDPIPGEEDWIELYNRGDAAVDLTDWLISDGGNFFPIPQGTILDPGDYLVYTRNDPGSFIWGFGDDEVVVLYDAQDDPVDSADWGLGEAVQPDSLGRLPNAWGPFEELTPTKGAANE